jgi:hypothetical protein
MPSFCSALVPALLACIVCCGGSTSLVWRRCRVFVLRSSQRCIALCCGVSILISGTALILCLFCAIALSLQRLRCIVLQRSQHPILWHRCQLRSARSFQRSVALHCAERSASLIPAQLPMSVLRYCARCSIRCGALCYQESALLIL